MNTIEFGLLAVVGFFCLFLGNCAGDQATLRDCATTGQALMLGGGAVLCEVKREAKK